MDLRAMLLFLCLCALTISPTEASIPKCCRETAVKIPLAMLLKVVRYEEQQIGACDIKALVLYVSGRRSPVCAHPQVRKSVLSILKKRRLRKHKSGAWGYARRGAPSAVRFSR